MKEVILKSTDKRFNERANTLRYLQISKHKLTEDIREFMNRQEIIEEVEYPDNIRYEYIGEQLGREKLIELGYENEGRWRGIKGGSIISIPLDEYDKYKKLGYQVKRLVPGRGAVDLKKYKEEK